MGNGSICHAKYVAKKLIKKENSTTATNALNTIIKQLKGTISFKAVYLLHISISKENN